MSSALDRRRFLRGSAQGLCGLLLAGIGLAGLARQARSTPAQALRPPGALADEAFARACIRCGLCVHACPYDTLHLARLGEPLPAGTPYFTARTVPCEMCDDLPCVRACPTGALDPGLTDIDQARMGLAVLIDQTHCLNFLGLRCDVCYRVCPLIDRAITLVREHNERTGKHTRFIPTINADACTGCGKCEQACVLPGAAIKVLPRTLAQGKASPHYRLGWQEQEQAGAPLIPDVLTLPVRRPEARP